MAELVRIDDRVVFEHPETGKTTYGTVVAFDEPDRPIVVPIHGGESRDADAVFVRPEDEDSLVRVARSAVRRA